MLQRQPVVFWPRSYAALSRFKQEDLMENDKKRLIELLGVTYLTNKLYHEQIYIARPCFDNGIDFIAYFTDQSNSFQAIPV